MSSSAVLHTKNLPIRQTTKTTISDTDSTSRVKPWCELCEAFEEVNKIQDDVLKAGYETLRLHCAMAELLQAGPTNVRGTHEYQDLKHRVEEIQAKYDALDAEYVPKYEALRAANGRALRAKRLESNAERSEQAAVVETQDQDLGTEADLAKMMDQIEALRI